MSVLKSRRLPYCRIGGTGYGLFLLGGGPHTTATQRLELAGVSDVALRALSDSHRLHKHASNRLQDSGSVADRIW